MTRITSLSLILLLSAAALGAETNIAAKVDRWYWHPREMKVETMSETERREAITEIRRKVPPGSDIADVFLKSWRRLLLRLSDE